MGALGNGELGACRTPAEVLGLRSVSPLIEVAAGRHHSLALSATGEAYCWGMCGTPGECVDAPRRQADLGGRASAIGCGDDFCAALTPSGAMAWGGPQLGCYARMVVAASSASKLSCASRRVLLVDAHGCVIMSSTIDSSSSSTPIPGRDTRPMLIVPPNASGGERFVEVAGGPSMCACLSSGGEVYVFGETGELVPLHELRGVVRFTGGPSHILAVDASSRLVRLSAAVQSTASAAALPLLRAAAEGAAIEKLLIAQLRGVSPTQACVGGGGHFLALSAALSSDGPASVAASTAAPAHASDHFAAGGAGYYAACTPPPPPPSSMPSPYRPAAPTTMPTPHYPRGFADDPRTSPTRRCRRRGWLPCAPLRLKRGTTSLRPAISRRRRRPRHTLAAAWAREGRRQARLLR